MKHNLIYADDSYAMIGKCMEVHNQLGGGFAEAVYKDALEYEFRLAGIVFEREREYIVQYKDIVLPHRYYADFVVNDRIILEVKAVTFLTDEHIAQTLNYLAVSKNRLALLVNFKRGKMEYRRFVL